MIMMIMLMMQTLLAILLTASACTAATINILPLRFTLHVNQPSSTTAWSSTDLDAFSFAAKDYIDGHSLLQSALGASGYGGVSFTSSVTDARGRLRRLQNTLEVTLQEVTLQGSVELADYEVLPSEESVTEIVATLFQNGEQLFVKQIRSRAESSGASEWLTDVYGYDLVRIENTAENSSLGSSSLNEKSTDETAISQIAQAQTASSGGQQKNNPNLFIIIGVAGAAISLLLLLAGICYAKRTHNAPRTKKTQAKPASSLQNPKKQSILKNNSHTTKSLSPSSMPSHIPIQEDEVSDDESNADFMMARAALNNTHSSIQPRRVASGGFSVVSGANSSYADDNMSYAFSVDGQSIVGSKVSMGDVAIGAGGISAFQNENGGVFKWNEDGTKMVYIPAATSSATPNAEKAQNGFVYDELKKKWVLERKNVSFQNEGNGSTLITPPRQLQRSRTDDSCVTGFTEFSYDDVAANREMRPCPSTPQDEGVEVGMEDIGGRTYISDDASEFLPNENVGRFIMDDGDESTMFGSVLDVTDAETVTLPPPPPPPRQTMLHQRPVSPDTSMITNVTLEPGVIKRVPVVHEDLPFDEDIPFDERPKQRTGTKLKPKVDFSKHILPAAPDDGSVSDASGDSSHVLSDLKKLSKFMMERQRSAKGARSNSITNSSRSKRDVQLSSADYNRHKSL